MPTSWARKNLGARLLSGDSNSRSMGMRGILVGGSVPPGGALLRSPSGKRGPVARWMGPAGRGGSEGAEQGPGPRPLPAAPKERAMLFTVRERPFLAGVSGPPPTEGSPLPSLTEQPPSPELQGR